MSLLCCGSRNSKEKIVNSYKKEKLCRRSSIPMDTEEGTINVNTSNKDDKKSKRLVLYDTEPQSPPVLDRNIVTTLADYAYSKKIKSVPDSECTRVEGDGILSLYLSLIDELYETDSLQHILHDSERSRGLKDIMAGQSGRIAKFTKYLKPGIGQFYSNVKEGKLKDFEINSLDAVLTLLIIAAVYGTGSPQYKLIKDAMLVDTLFDVAMYIEVPISAILNINKKFKGPVLTKNKQFLPEVTDPCCVKIKNKCTIALFSDWAAGTTSAINLIKEVGKLNPDIAIHLGDVYHSGRKYEHIKKLIEPMCKYLPNSKLMTVPGNHDYYAGTEGIHLTIKTFGQKRTFFSLYNDKIQIEGLDTGFQDSDIIQSLKNKLAANVGVEDNELAWHNNRLKVAEKYNRSVVLLSHHMPVSTWTIAGQYQNKTSCVNHKLFAQFAPYLHLTQAWFFGHDHYFDVMESYTYNSATIKRPRLIGNGACQYRDQPLPEYSSNSIPGKFTVSENIVPRPSSKGIDPGTFLSILNNTFVILDINEERLKILYYTIPQTAIGVWSKPKVIHTESIPL